MSSLGSPSGVRLISSNVTLRSLVFTDREPSVLTEVINKHLDFCDFCRTTDGEKKLKRPEMTFKCLVT